MSLKSLIEAKKTELQQLGDPGDDAEKKLQKAKLEGQITALEEAEGDKEVFTQDDLNSVDQKAKQEAQATKDRIEKMFGTSIDSVETVLQNFDNVLPKTGDDTSGDQSGDQSGKGDADVLNRALNTITEQGKTIDTLRTEGTNFQRQYHEKEIRDKLAANFNNLGLVEDFAESANNYVTRVVGIDDLVDKKLKGETVTDEEIAAKANAVKGASEVWFTPRPNDDAPGIPVTPSGDPPKEFTDEERKNVSTASGGQVF